METHRDIKEAVADYIYVVRVEEGMPVETTHSETCFAVTGYNRQEFAGNPSLWIEMVVEEDRRLVLQQAKQALSGQFPSPLEHRIIHKGGSIRLVESSIIPNHAPGGKLLSYYGVIRDITERKKAEKELRESEQRFQLAAVAAIDIIYDYDVESETTHWVGDIDSCLGYVDGEFPDTPEVWTAIIYHKDIGKVMAAYKRCVETGGNGHFEYRVFRKDGTYRYWNEHAIPVFENKKLIKWIGAIRDITGFRKAEKSLLKKRNLLNTIINSTPDLIVLKDREMVYRHVNSAFCNFIGRQKNEIIGKTDFDLYPTDEARGYRHCDKKVMKTGRQKIQDEEVTGKEGPIWFQVAKTPLLDDKGGFAGILCSMRDMRKRKKMEEQLQAAVLTDELTGLFNRRGFYTLSEKHCKLSTRFKRALSLLYLDLDGMKNINDELGHKAGDQALVDTANILKKTFRDSDVIARIGGDEFAVLLTEHSEPDIENIIIEHLKDNLRIHNEQSGRNYELLLSLGIVRHDPAQLCSIDKLLSMADELMYEDKMHHKIEKQELQPLNYQVSERRAYRRIRTGSNCWARLNGSGRIRIMNISLKGVCLQSRQRLPVGNDYNVKLFYNDNEAILSAGELVWSTLTADGNSNEDSSHYYESGLKFIKTDNDLKLSLLKLIGTLTT
jgi:diguanylate cyclase (GGDEF)-like protein/PAS domain S-box-containing protein